MLPKFVIAIAWSICEKHVQENYVHRAYLDAYADNLKDDFPILSDMQKYFKDRPFGRCSHLSNHKMKMQLKYKLPIKPK